MYRSLRFLHIPAILSFSHDPISTLTSKIMTSTLEITFAQRYILPTNALPKQMSYVLSKTTTRKNRSEITVIASKPFPRGKWPVNNPNSILSAFSGTYRYAMRLKADIPYVTSPNLLYCLMMMNSKSAVYSRRCIKYCQWKLASALHLITSTKTLNKITSFNYI